MVGCVIDTHNHFDHTFGNAEFAGLSAVIIAQVNCPANMRRSEPSVIKNTKNYGLCDEEIKAIQITYPDPSFTDRLKMDLGGVNVEVLYIARSHTDDSLLVYLPEEKVLFTGDALFTDCYPFMGYGYIPGWIKTIDYISTLNVDKIIPGHGPISGKKDVADMKAYLLAFDKKERRLCAKSNDIEYRAAEIKKSVPRRAQADFLIMGSIQAKYLKKR